MWPFTYCTGSHIPTWVAVLLKRVVDEIVDLTGSVSYSSGSHACLFSFMAAVYIPLQDKMVSGHEWTKQLQGISCSLINVWKRRIPYSAFVFPCYIQNCVDSVKREKKEEKKREIYPLHPRLPFSLSLSLCSFLTNPLSLSLSLLLSLYIIPIKADQTCVCETCVIHVCSV